MNAPDEISFEIEAKGTVANVIELSDYSLYTRWTTDTVAVKDKKVIEDIKRDLLKMAVIERHTRSGNIAVGLVKGMHAIKWRNCSQILP